MCVLTLSLSHSLTRYPMLTAAVPTPAAMVLGPADINACDRISAVGRRATGCPTPSTLNPTGYLTSFTLNPEGYPTPSTLNPTGYPTPFTLNPICYPTP